MCDFHDFSLTFFLHLKMSKNVDFSHWGNCATIICSYILPIYYDIFPFFSPLWYTQQHLTHAYWIYVHTMQYNRQFLSPLICLICSVSQNKNFRVRDFRKLGLISSNMKKEPFHTIHSQSSNHKKRQKPPFLYYFQKLTLRFQNLEQFRK